MPLFNSSKILSKIVQYGDNLTAHSARAFKSDAEALRRSRNLGPHGVPDSTINHVQDLADKARANSTSTRINTGLGLGIGVGGGMYGIHRHHKNKDDKIMERINQMYYN